MVLCLQTWESAAEELKAACLAEKGEHPCPRQVWWLSPLLQHVHHSWQPWQSTAWAACCACVHADIKCCTDIKAAPDTPSWSPAHNPPPPKNPFKAGLLLPRNEFYLRAHGMAQDSSAIALCWLELGEFTMPQLKKKNKPKTLLFLGSRVTLQSGHSAKWPQVAAGSGHSPGAATLLIDSWSAHTDTTGER